MEKTPVAIAMEWSIQLEKGLRSKKPGKSIEALNEIGSHLEFWNNESKATEAVEKKMFDLIHGEEKLYLNSIFLRLADAFRFGNKEIKNGVVRIFMKIRRRKKKMKGTEGILSKDKLENFLELLRKVKEVFDYGDIEERVLSLLLFGCWAEFAKDCADIRYIVLSSLVSRDVLEVKASLFSAGCLGELSDDFGNVFLEMLTPILISPDISRNVKLAGGRAFSKLCCSFSLAEKAYKTGLKLLMNSSEDDFSAVMLISLSKISYLWKLLLPVQVKLLAMFLSEDRTFQLQTTSLRCFRFISARVWDFSASKEIVQNLFTVLDKSEYTLTQQLEALKVLHKILPFYLSIIPCTEMPAVFAKIVAIVENMLKSSNFSTRLLGVKVLADLSCKIFGRTSAMLGRKDYNLVCQVVSFVLDRISFLLTLKVEVQPSSSELEVKSLLNLLFILVERHSHICCLVLRKICAFIDELMKILDSIVNSKQTLISNPDLVKSVMIYTSKILVVCLENNEETDSETYQVLCATNFQAEHVCQSSYFDGYTRICYLFVLHFHATYERLRNIAEKLVSDSGSTSLSFADSDLQLNRFTIDCAKKILDEKCYWSSYKVGKIASCLGAWSTAAFIFEQLTKEVKSVTCVCWLKSLAQFSTSEYEIQLVLFDCNNSGFPDINLAERESAVFKINQECMKKLLRAHNTLLSSKKELSACNMGNIFSFQVSFLTLRAKLLKTVVDILNILDTLSQIRDRSMLSEHLKKSILFPCIASCNKFDSLINTSYEVSSRMKKLAQEFDLLLMSFMGMNKQSVLILSALGWSCSLMAFATGFALVISNVISSENCGNFKAENSEETFHASLVEDLVVRLKYVDSDAKRNLLVLLKSCHNYEGHSIKHVQTQISSTDYESGVLQRLSEYCIRGIVALEKDSSHVQQDANIQCQMIEKGSELLFNVISKWLLTSFRTPRHFFRVRPPLSSELIVMTEDGKYLDGTTILSGCHLSLNMCFQLKNMESDHSSQVTKVYCILHCKIQNQIQVKVWKSSDHSEDHEIDDIVDLNQKLLRHAIVSSDHSSKGQPVDCCVINEYLRFQLDKRGQGFSNCLLDVSAFPVGSYRIKWHSGFIDGEGSYRSLLPLKAGSFFTFHITTTI